MPKLKPDHVFVTDEEDAVITAAALSDPDNPPLTDEEWERVKPHVMSARDFFSPEQYAALTDKSRPATITLVSDEEDRARQKRMGRPPLAAPKEVTTIRLDADVMGAFRAIGRGWQTRINAVLREAVAAGRV